MTTKSILLVGDTGRMGSMLHARLSAAGLSVRGVDRPLEHEKYALCRDASLVLLCVPIAALSEVSARISPYLDGSQVLADIASVKMQPLAQMQAAYSGPVVGTHPLFGPDGGKHADASPRVAICPGDAARERDVQLLESIFARIGCVSFRTTAERHDEAAAFIQGLNFITSAAYFATLAEHTEFLPFLTPSFTRRMEAARNMFTHDGKLFEALFEANPAGQEAVRRYRSYLNLAAGGDISLLRERAAWWWKDAAHGRKQ